MSSIGCDFPKAAPLSRRGNRCLLFLVGLVWVVAVIGFSRAKAQDFSDPADILRYKQQNAQRAEIAGTIRETTTNKPGWYGVFIALGEGKQVHVIIAPSTKFYKDGDSINADAAYPQIKAGQKIRALHNPQTDEAVRNIIITDLMFVNPPPEVDGVIGATASGKRAGTSVLVIALDKGGEVHLVIDAKTVFWSSDNKPLDPTAAHSRLAAGQKVRMMPRTSGDGASVSDVMFVDR